MDALNDMNTTYGSLHYGGPANSHAQASHSTRGPGQTPLSEVCSFYPPPLRPPFPAPAHTSTTSVIPPPPTSSTPRSHTTANHPFPFASEAEVDFWSVFLRLLLSLARQGQHHGPKAIAPMHTLNPCQILSVPAR